LFGIGHRLATPATNDGHIAAFRLFYHPSSAKITTGSPSPPYFGGFPPRADVHRSRSRRHCCSAPVRRRKPASLTINKKATRPLQ
jgi:hypothetical protein